MTKIKVAERDGEFSWEFEVSKTLQLPTLFKYIEVVNRSGKCSISIEERKFKFANTTISEYYVLASSDSIEELSKIHQTLFKLQTDLETNGKPENDLDTLLDQYLTT